LALALRAEMHDLVSDAAVPRETTLLIHPYVLGDFLDYNDFLRVADDLLLQEGFEGVLQVASFHPQYQFAGTAADDVTNATNRSPYPTLHLLREQSVERAVAATAETDAIDVRNLATMRALGAAGWRALQARCKADAEDPAPP
jgi:uncharacterized protein